MSQLRSIAVLLGTALIGLTGSALGCTCMFQSPEGILKSAPLIFRGKVTSVDRSRQVAFFKIETVYKGTAASAFELNFEMANGINCGTNFEKDKVETVFAYVYSAPGRPEMFTTNGCAMGPHQSSPLAYQAAIDLYRVEVGLARKEANIRPRATAGWERVAKIQEEHRDWMQVLETLDHLSMLDPRKAEYRNRKGHALMGLARFEPALQAYQEALSLNPQFAPAKKGHDQALLKLGRTQELDKERRDYSGMELRNADFSGRQLHAANYAKTYLNVIKFRGTNLTRADLSEARMHNVDFTGANLENARLTKVDATGADFSGANLKRATLRESQFGGVKFDGADLGNADLSGAKLWGASFRKANLEGTRLEKAVLSGADFSATDLSGRNFAGMELQGADFRGTILRNANLEGAYLAGPGSAFRDSESLHGPGRGADLRGTDLQGARVKGADLRYALYDCKTRWPEGFDALSLPLLPISSAECPGPPPKTMLFKPLGELREMPGRFGGERAKVRGPEFSKLDLAGVNLSGANLSGFRFSSSTFTNANLTGADLRNADLQGSTLLNVNLADADLSGATLWSCDLTGANLAGANLKGAQYSSATRWPSGFNPNEAGALLSR